MILTERKKREANYCNYKKAPKQHTEITWPITETGFTSPF